MTVMLKISDLTRALLVGIVLVFGLAGCAATDTRESVGEYAGDSVVTGKVKAALAKEDVESLLAIEVETYRGVVQLSGFVDSEEMKTRAGEVASSVDDVERVENSLIVKPEA